MSPARKRDVITNYQNSVTGYNVAQKHTPKNYIQSQLYKEIYQDHSSQEMALSLLLVQYLMLSDQFFLFFLHNIQNQNKQENKHIVSNIRIETNKMKAQRIVTI